MVGRVIEWYKIFVYIVIFGIIVESIIYDQKNKIKVMLLIVYLKFPNPCPSNNSLVLILFIPIVVHLIGNNIQQFKAANSKGIQIPFKAA